MLTKHDKNWDKNFQLLCEYKKEFGDCNVPRKFIFKGVKLGVWCDRQRQVMNNTARYGFLSKDRIDKLNSIGFIWNLNEYKWNKNFQLLCNYKEEFGDCNIPDSFIYNNFHLGRWCTSIRQSFKGNKNYSITEDRINQLNSIGFKW